MQETDEKLLAPCLSGFRKTSGKFTFHQVAHSLSRVTCVVSVFPWRAEPVLCALFCGFQHSCTVSLGVTGPPSALGFPRCNGMPFPMIEEGVYTAMWAKWTSAAVPGELRSIPPPLLEGRLPQIYLQSDDVTFGGDDDEGKVERAMLLPSSQPLLSLPSQWLCAPPWARTNFSLLSKLLIPSCVIAPFFLQILLCKARYDQTRFLGDQWEMEQKVRYSSNYTFISLYFHDFSVYKMWK